MKKQETSAGFTFDVDALLDSAEKKFRLTRTGTDTEARRTAAMPTGLLSLDLMLGGGLLPGLWATVYGGEGSAKSTLLATLMGTFADLGLKQRYDDFEGSTDPVYLSNLLEQLAGLRDSSITAAKLFGVPNPKTGGWLTAPMVRLYSENIGDNFFNSLSSIARALPDKVFIAGKWYYVFDEKPTEGKIVASLSSREKGYYVECAHPYAELVAFVDSYPQMFPDSLDDDDANSGMAAVARMFSTNIPKIAGRLKRKAILVIGVNQLRLKPGVSYGNPEYEPAGQAVKYASAIRIKNTARSVPHGKGASELEPSVLFDGDDTYKYVNMCLTKNKSATSIGLESWQRIWAADPQGRAFGFCPVWNIYDYLVLTGQAVRFGSGKKRLIELAIRNTDGSILYENPKFEFAHLKSLVLLKGGDRVAFAKSLGITKETYQKLFAGASLYNHLRSQIVDGCALMWAYELKGGVTPGTSSLGKAEPNGSSYEEDEEDEESGDAV